MFRYIITGPRNNIMLERVIEEIELNRYANMRDAQNREVRTLVKMFITLIEFLGVQNEYDIELIQVRKTF